MAKEKLIFEGGRIIVCTEYAAQYFGVTAATLSNWQKVGCPQHAYGYWDIKAVTEYRQALAEQRVDAEAEGDPDKMTLSQQKTYYEGQLKQAQLESAQFRNAINKGDYLARKEVLDDLRRLFLVLKRSFQGLGRRLSREVGSYLDPGQARIFDSQITQVVNDALEQMSEEGVLDDTDE